MKKTPGDIIFHMCTINDNHIYGSWDMEHGELNFLSFPTIFWTFTPLKTWKIKILKNWKKFPGDIMILQMCIINDNHMIYGSWDMEWNWQSFFVILDNFYSFASLTTLKIKILKKWKKCLKILSFLHMCTRNDNHMM